MDGQTDIESERIHAYICMQECIKIKTTGGVWTKIDEGT